MLATALNFIFAPVLKLPIYGSVFVISGLITLLVTVINRKFTDVEMTKKVKDRIEAERAKMLEAQKKGDKDKMNSHMKKMMQINSEFMKLMTKPMIVSIVLSALLLIFIFPWLNGVYTGQVALTLPQLLPLIGGKGVSWLIWYIVCSLAVSIALRKVLGM
ncbi:hypothetical protein A3K63_05545 [Candidatus Micrarchaeota archaeon RBG_16_49_10]|nr:MAG: hypothetical protein A3K63_05545 [Candidatus Micrarchaeota archaeon RBG_16_49_10]